jgi:hypothetical protein
MTFGELVNTVLKLAYPNRMARNLIPLRQFHVQQGLIQIQRAVRCLQVGNTDRIDHGQLLHQCWWSEHLAPEGHIREVWVEAHPLNIGCACKRVRVDFVSSDQFDALPGSYEDAAEFGTICWPAPRAWFSIFRERVLRIYPAVNQAGWQLVVKWDGLRKVWQSTDEIDLDGWEDVIEALRLFVTYRGLPDEGCTAEDMKVAFDMFNNQIRLLVYDCRQRMEAEKRMHFGSATPPEPPFCSFPQSCSSAYVYAQPL